MNKILRIFIAISLIITLAFASLEIESIQELIVRRMAIAAMSQASVEVHTSNSLKVFVCGTSSPISSPDRAQACIAVLTPEHFYIVDSGAGSTDNLTSSRLPMNRLRGLFITHFHSDHIAEIPEVNLNSWIQGRAEPLEIIGPEGVEKIVTGLNLTYALDRQYRTAHHGTDLLPPDLGVLKAKAVSAGDVLQDGDLTVTVFRASHAPAHPAVGYRFDYKGRSLVISGDGNVTEYTYQAAENADLLLHDALSEPIVSILAEVAEDAGLSRNAKVLTDVLDYHAWTSSLVELGKQSNVGMVAYYHLVPAPRNIVMQQIFERDLPENHLIAEDRMWFDLPTGSKEIIVSQD